MRKKAAIIITVLLVVGFCAGGAVIYRGSQADKIEEQEEQEQREKEASLANAREQLENQKKETKETAGPAEGTEKPAETVSVLDEKEPADKADLSEEAQIEKPRKASQGTEAMPDLKGELESMTAGYQGDWSIYVKNLSSGEYLEINSHAVKAASLIKLFIMGAVLEQTEEGLLAEDGTFNQLLHDMITVSDNESSNELVRRLSPDGTDHEKGMEVVNAFARAYGYEDTSQGRDLRDYREVPAAGENYTSVHDCGLFLQRVYEGECISAGASAKMLELLKQQTRTWKIPAGVPEGVVTANKTGELSDTENDAALVFSPGGDYILCVTAAELTDTSAAQANIVSISSAVYQYINQ